MIKLGLGGGCHWCTEAVFASLKGVTDLKQGWLAGEDHNSWYSEGVILKYDPKIISLEELIDIHLSTHSSSSEHALRERYRTAVYCTSQEQQQAATKYLNSVAQKQEKAPLTIAISLAAFKYSRPEIRDYFYSDLEKPFCKNIIKPKLLLLAKQFPQHVIADKIALIKRK